MVLEEDHVIVQKYTEEQSWHVLKGSSLHLGLNKHGAVATRKRVRVQVQ
jgi:hypothetical protein